MKSTNKIKQQLKDDLLICCDKNSIDYESLQKLIGAERVKKLRKGNHYIQKVIDQEIENAIENENK